jgi:nucleoredoxin
VSSDQSQEQFEEYFASMPWLALPFPLRDLKTALGQMFEVRGIPALILLDGASGKLISNDGRCMTLR